MRTGFSLNLEQTQKLIMTPELRQAIAILHMPVQELAEYVDEQLLENPVLETKEEADERTEREEKAESEDRLERQESQEREVLVGETIENLAQGKELDWQEYFQDKSDLGFVPVKRDNNDFSYEHYLAVTPTLHEYLVQQLSLSVKDSTDLTIGEYLIGNLDDNGYLTVSLDEAAQGTGCALETANRLLTIIQGFEPAGVGARNLQECLLIQLAQIPDPPPMAKELIENHLIDLGAGKITKIASSLGVSPKEVQELGDFLRKLDPKPGRKFSSTSDVRYVVPDVVLEKVNGEYIILVNDTTVPRLGINRGYREMLQRGAEDEAKKYVETKLHAAVSLIRSIEQRRLTLYKVVKCIIELQKDFFEKGIRYLKPMTLRQVAEIVNLHESTVSRATAAKFMQAPQGVFELKFFFASGVENVTGDMTSSESIKRIMQELVENEDPANPLSDQKITDIFQAKGINISRRTVAKYRDEMGMPSTTMRKRY